VESISLAVRSGAKDVDGDVNMIDSGVENMNNDSEDEDNFFTDDDLGFSIAHSNNIQNSSQAHFDGPMDEQLKRRICQDLIAAKEAGFRVGLHHDILSGKRCYVCLSVRISKLGLSEEAMRAWNVKADQYLVLVICYRDGYRPINDILSATKQVSFKVGLCSTYKPNLKELVALFQSNNSYQEVHNNLRFEQDGSVGEVEVSTRWTKSFISSPLESLFNERFIFILMNRLAGMPWNGAEKFFYENQTVTSMANEIDDKYLQQETVQLSYPPIVQADAITDSWGSDNSHSFPVVSMQFLLRHFVRCTEFCLVCHRRTDIDIEAIKPYVCSEPLCLYQYMSLGFGPEIEHEILSQPDVVDLLISFCWYSAKRGKLSDFPTGLGLNVPDEGLFVPISKAVTNRNTPQMEEAVQPNPLQYDVVDFDTRTCELIYPSKSVVKLQVGKWVLVQETKNDSIDQYRHHQVKAVCSPVVKLSKNPLHPNMSLANLGPIQSSKNPKALVKVRVFQYHRNFDDLFDEYKRAAIVSQIDLLPSVTEMKEWLLLHPSDSLKRWQDKISPAALGILRWIIASNRACIMEVDDTARIRGMDGWAQFRFAMGAPVSHDILVVSVIARC
jgi:hypothetical protein